VGVAEQPGNAESAEGYGARGSSENNGNSSHRYIQVKCNCAKLALTKYLYYYIVNIWFIKI